MSLSRRRYRKRPWLRLLVRSRCRRDQETSEMSSSSRRRCHRTRDIRDIGARETHWAVYSPECCRINERADGPLVITPTSRSFCGAKRRRRGPKGRPTGGWDAGIILKKDRGSVVVSQSKSSGYIAYYSPERPLSSQKRIAFRQETIIFVDPAAANVLPLAALYKRPFVRRRESQHVRMASLEPLPLP